MTTTNSTPQQKKVSKSSVEGSQAFQWGKKSRYSTRHKAAVLSLKVMTTKGYPTTVWYFVDPDQNYLIRTSQVKANELFTQYQNFYERSSKLTIALEASRKEAANLRQELRVSKEINLSLQSDKEELESINTSLKLELKSVNETWTQRLTKLKTGFQNWVSKSNDAEIAQLKAELASREQTIAELKLYKELYDAE